MRRSGSSISRMNRRRALVQIHGHDAVSAVVAPFDPADARQRWMRQMVGSQERVELEGYPGASAPALQRAALSRITHLPSTSDLVQLFIMRTKLTRRQFLGRTAAGSMGLVAFSARGATAAPIFARRGYYVLPCRTPTLRPAATSLSMWRRPGLPTTDLYEPEEMPIPAPPARETEPMVAPGLWGGGVMPARQHRRRGARESGTHSFAFARGLCHEDHVARIAFAWIDTSRGAGWR